MESASNRLTLNNLNMVISIEPRTHIHDYELQLKLKNMPHRELDNAGELEAIYNVEIIINDLLLIAEIKATTERHGNQLSYMDNGHEITDPQRARRSIEIISFNLYDNETGNEIHLTSEQGEIIKKSLKSNLILI